MCFAPPQGVTTGLVVGLALALWVSFGASFSGAAPPVMLPSSVDGCDFNVTIAASATEDVTEMREK